MINNNSMENRAIPYRMLSEVLSTSAELIERVLPDGAIPSLKLGAKAIDSVLQKNIIKMQEGLPIVGYHFSLPAEFLYCFDCIPVCIEGVSFYLAALLLNGVEKYYDMMESWGHPYHTCTSQNFCIN